VPVDIVLLTKDMSRFADILRPMGLPELADKYEAQASDLRANRSSEAVSAARAWVARSFGRGVGSLSDRYVSRNGAVDEALNAEYEELLQRLTDFANGK